MTTIAQETAPLTRRKRRWEGLPYWLILPTVVYLGLFFVWPMIQSFGLALRDETGGWSLTAFRTMVDDTAFGEAMSFTFLLILVIVPIQFVLAFGMALLLNAKLRGAGIFLYIFLLPLAISDLAAGIAWSAIFTELGYLNTILEGVGAVDQPYIFLDPESRTQQVLVVATAEIWRSTTFMMVILYAGLQGIPRDYVEAAEVFGAGFFQRVRHVIFPLLKPSIQVALLLRLIFAFEVFAVVIALTGSGATVLAAEAYKWQATNQNEHVAAAYSVVILGLSLAAAAVVLVVLRTPRERRLR
ncbi:MAG: sugar ABC transporter permease [Actinomycetota bacterium]|nr:sugar ABC transporter permease [Actinomycetota bacterium]